jgi:xylulokinase
MYGIEIMREMGLNINVIRAGQANMFLSPVFRQTLANVTGASIQLYDTDGAQGAARGAAYGAGYYKSFAEAFVNLKKLNEVYPENENKNVTISVYKKWLEQLNKSL